MKHASRLALSLTLALIPGLAPAQTLVGFARLPADSFAAGPTSGQFITDPPPINGRTPPFVDRQPIQGFSSVLRAANGDLLVMEDNGFGAKENSRDYVLRVYRVTPDFAPGPVGRAKSPLRGSSACGIRITRSDSRLSRMG